MQGGSEDTERLPEGPSIQTGERLLDASRVQDGDPEEIADATDATDGLGSVMFTKEERVDAGFFGICPPRYIPWPIHDCAILTLPFQGPSSNISFTREILSATMFVVNRSGAESLPDVDDKTRGSIHSHVFLLSRSGSQGPSPDQRDGEIRGQPINLYDLPPADQALHLIHGYFENTGLLFPYIHRDRFIQTYKDLASVNLRSVRKPWLGMLNMILALSINVSYPSELSQQQRAAESKVFFLRAMSLCEGQIRSTASLEIGALNLAPWFLLVVATFTQLTSHPA